MQRNADIGLFTRPSSIAIFLLNLHSLWPVTGGARKEGPEQHRLPVPFGVARRALGESYEKSHRILCPINKEIPIII